MKQIYQWEFVLVSQSPLRIGGDQDELLLNDQGRPFLPGTSWAGACRSYMEFSGQGDRLFGDQGIAGVRNPSQLIFSDGVCLVTQPFDSRPRVKIEGKSKTVENFFEHTTVSAGVEFLVKLILRTDSVNDQKLVEAMLSALHSGFIRLGAYKSTGGGRFTIKDGMYVHWDCTKPEDLEAYIHQTKQRSSWEPDVHVEHSTTGVISMKGRTNSPLLIAGQYASDSSKSDRASIQAQYNGRNHFVIPGSSLKGILRHRIQRTVNELGLAQNYVEHIFRGRLLLEDIILDGSKTKVYHRVAIHPITGGYKDGALLDEETVSGDFQTKLNYLYQNDSDYDAVALALISFALRDLADQRQNIGSGGSIGRGDIQIDEMEVKLGGRTMKFDFQKKKVTDETNWLHELQLKFGQAVKREEVG